MIGPLVAGAVAIVIACGLILFVWLRIRQIEDAETFTGDTDLE